MNPAKPSLHIVQPRPSIESLKAALEAASREKAHEFVESLDVALGLAEEVIASNAPVGVQLIALEAKRQLGAHRNNIVSLLERK